MDIAKAINLEQAHEMLNSGKNKAVELDFDVDADTFFSLSAEYYPHGAKITRHENHFVIKLNDIELSVSE